MISGAVIGWIVLRNQRRKRLRASQAKPSDSPLHCRIMNKKFIDEIQDTNWQIEATSVNEQGT